MKYIRLFSDDEGETHFEDAEMELEPHDVDYSDLQIKASSFNPSQYAFFMFPAGLETNWHPAPQKPMIIILSGEMELHVSDGEFRNLHAGSIVLNEDVNGKGHKGKVTSTTEVFGVTIQPTK